MGKAFILKNMNFQQVGLGQVTVAGNIPIEALAIVAPASFAGEFLQLTARVYPLNTAQRGVSWSIVSGSAYASINATTGLLTVLDGADSDDVVVRATSTADATILAEKTITVSYGEQSVEIIYGLQTDGLAGIMTDYVPNQYTEVRAKFILDSWNDQTLPTVYGNFNDASEGWFGFFWSKYGNKWSISVATNVLDADTKYTQDTGSVRNFGDTFDIEHTSSSFTVGYQTVSLTTTETALSDNPLCIFAHRLPGTGATSICGLTLLEFDIYEQNVLVASYRPAKLSNGILGVYDSIADKFFGNAYSGSFAEVSDPND